MNPAQCPKCKAHSDVRVQDAGNPFETTISCYCFNCYDADCDQDGYFTDSHVAYGSTMAEAIDEWNEWVAEEAAE